MRKNIIRGGLSSRELYKILRENVWKEIQKMDKEELCIHDRDIQEVALIEAEKLNLNQFKVIFKINNYNKII